MKHFIFFAFAFSFFTVAAQNYIEPYAIYVAANKTTNIIFPYAIKSVDRGSRDVLAQKAKGIENILQLKAAAQNFAATNISVITSDGRLYSFIVNYDPEPKKLNISFAKDSPANAILFSSTTMNDAMLDSDAADILRQKHFLHYSTHSEKMKFSLKSIYIKDQLLWFTFVMSNQSLIDYPVEYLRCFIHDKKRAKRTAVQATELIPVYNSALLKAIAGNSRQNFVLAFSPFTIAKNKKVVIEASESNGGRSLRLRLPCKALLKTRMLK